MTHSCPTRLAADLPSHSTTRDAISVYLQQRDRACPTGDDLFISNNGRAPSKSAVSNVFIHLARQLGFRGPVGTPGPRLHDLRHSRSEERRVGKECVSTCRSRWRP